MRRPATPRTKKRRNTFSLSAMSAAAALGAGVFGSAPAVAQDLTETIAKAAGVPQMDAFLPDKYSVEETEALPIDGVWMISTIKKKIRIEKGRAYAVDSWLHLFTLKVQRDMVVVQNMERIGAGQYEGDDLPLMGRATYRLRDDGNLSVNVKGALGPAAFALIKREVDDPQAFAAELAALRGGGDGRPTPPPPAEDPVDPPEDDPVDDGADNPPPGSNPLDDCKKIGVDRDTGALICAD